MREEINELCDTIERCYEFMLAYAGQGVSGDEGGQSGGQVRDSLEHAAKAIAGLAEVYSRVAKEERLQPADRYQAFLTVLESDARSALAAVHLVLAQATLSSQLIDNLNASIHLRALLTDLFLIDEILKPQRISAKPATTG